MIELLNFWQFPFFLICAVLSGIRKIDYAQKFVQMRYRGYSSVFAKPKIPKHKLNEFTAEEIEFAHWFGICNYRRFGLFLLFVLILIVSSLLRDSIHPALLAVSSFTLFFWALRKVNQINEDAKPLSMKSMD